MTDLYDALRQVVQILNELQIEFAVVGGIAVRVLGIPRPTHDLDFTLALDHAALGRLFERLEAIGLTVSDEYRTGWRDRVADMPLVKAKLYLAGRSIDVDMFLAETEFQQSLMSRRHRQTVEGIELWMVTPEDLILLKLMANRIRDQADIADVLFMQGKLDEQYMRHWAKALSVEALLEKSLADAKGL